MTLESHWGDVVGLFLISLGALLAVGVASPVSQDIGKGLVGAGLIALKLKTNPGNGKVTPPVEPKP